MSDIKLFRVNGTGVIELESRSATVEKSLQSLMERHLEALLGIRFLATEYTTGKSHSGRIDTLGIDENGSPVIIEYKRALNENVINQGLFYLDWLLDHKAEFVLLTSRQLGATVADEIDWSAPRLLCIAGDFTRYDQYAVQQINRTIELIRYRQYSDNLLVLELVNASTADAGPAASSKSAPRGGGTKTAAEYLDQSSAEVKDRYESLRSFLLALGDDVQEKNTTCYIAFKRIRNFACVEVHPRDAKILVFAKIDPATIELIPGFTRDVSNIGHFGTGNLEITITSDDQLEKAKPFLVKSYEVS